MPFCDLESVPGRCLEATHGGCHPLVKLGPRLGAGRCDLIVEDTLDFRSGPDDMPGGGGLGVSYGQEDRGHYTASQRERAR